MSLDFIKMVSDLKDRRLLIAMNGLATSKIPCGVLFVPNVPDGTREIVDALKSAINLNCICLLGDEYKQFFPAADDEKVIAVEEFESLEIKPKYIFSFGGFFGFSFMDYFDRYGTQMITSIDVTGAENLYHFYMKHLPEQYSVHEMLADEESKKVFRAAITGSLTQVMQDFRFASEPQYFLNGFLPTEGDIAIDGGAFDGATSVDFVKQGAQVYAFEMDENNYKNCLPVAEKFGFTIENLGLSNQEGEARYSCGGAGSSKLKDTSEGVIGHFIDIDTYVARKNLPRVDYIKLDVEGAELETLQGAAKTITRWKPKMAVSAYHKVEDLWTLATYIKSLRPDYEFQFRHYRIDCKDYLFDESARSVLSYFGLNYSSPSGCEKVLYCR